MQAHAAPKNQNCAKKPNRLRFARPPETIAAMKSFPKPLGQSILTSAPHGSHRSRHSCLGKPISWHLR
jgi:hypothetical protein